MKLPNIPRRNDGSRLISDWCIVKDKNNFTLRAYYHIWFGWMVRGESVGEFIHGFIPIKFNKLFDGEVISFEK